MLIYLIRIQEIFFKSFFFNIIFSKYLLLFPIQYILIVAIYWKEISGYNILVNITYIDRRKK